MHERPEKRPRAVLVGVQLPDVDERDLRLSLAELERLVHTLGYDVVGTVTQRRAHLAAAAVVGEGKLHELARYTGGTGVVPPPVKPKKRKGDDEEEAPEEEAPEADGDESDEGDAESADGGAGDATVVAVDHELSPTQVRNLEQATGAEVLDRTSVILEIFSRHARSREARLQVEIARLGYLAPRLRESGGGGDRVRGGVGGKGAGESALELDRRKIRDRIAELREELDAVAREQETRRARRQRQPRVALVGYTNAGKSSLMRALTGSEVYVADKLFATLDTTVRALHPESHPRVLVSDTVGFIKKLPHDLVASFRSTLDEAREASLVLHVVDGSDPDAAAQLRVTREVLAEIGAGDIDARLLFNKRDRMTEDQLAEVAREHPDALLVSARDPADVARLRGYILDFFDRDMVDGEVLVPYGAKGVIAEVHRDAKVVEEDYDERGARFRVRATPEVLARLQSLASRGE
ncbi:MAG: GTPase HflX [Polyangiales bacterium]